MTILLKHHIQQHNTMKINQHFAAFAVAAALASCGTTDTEPPTVCDSDNLTGLPSILAGELEVEAGTTVTIHDAFCDNDGLAEIRWDLHSAEGHAHEEEEEGEEHEGEEHEEVQLAQPHWTIGRVADGAASTQLGGRGEQLHLRFGKNCCFVGA